MTMLEYYERRWSDEESHMQMLINNKMNEVANRARFEEVTRKLVELEPKSRLLNGKQKNELRNLREERNQLVGKLGNLCPDTKTKQQELDTFRSGRAKARDVLNHLAAAWAGYEALPKRFRTDLDHRFTIRGPAK